MTVKDFTRREFMGSVSIGAAGLMLAPNYANARTKQRIDFAKESLEHPMDTRIAVKPVFSPLIHTDVWEGPCRPSAGRKPKKDNIRDPNDFAAYWAMADGKQPEQERADAEAGYKEFTEYLKKNLGPDTRLLEPAFMEYSEDFWISPEKLSKLEPDKDNTDAYIIAPVGMYNYTASVIAETFKKPVLIGSGHFISRDAVAYLKANGLEGCAVFGPDEANHYFSLLRTLKTLQQTRILIIADRKFPPIPIRSCISIDTLKDKFGIGCHFVSYREFISEMDSSLKNKELGKKAEDRANQLIKNAQETHIDRQYIKRSLEFYYTVKNLMNKYDCNAFTVECFDLCASRLAERYKITPCLVHTLLKDEGIASACEGDLNALLSMRLLMSVANRSSFMGNPIAFSKDQLVINHSVPGMKMAGYEKPDLPYHLRHFVESGWGTKVMIDFTRLEDKTVTLARLNPLGTKIYLAKGEVVLCSGFNKGTLIGCSLAAHIKVPDSYECLRKLNEFGSHLCMVYGDYTGEVAELADMMGLDLVYAT